MIDRPKIPQTPNLVGKMFRIQLHTDPEPYTYNKKPVPILPAIEGKLIRRIHTWTWCYLAELTEPLFLDIEGVHEKARKKTSTRFIKILPSVIWSKRRDDNLGIELPEGKTMDVTVSYVDDPAAVPNELATGETVDPFFEKIPVISGGSITLKV